ncbi:MAG: hypothetical protein HQL73_04940 [Magnetococcales bacterium]|nr:hypothetical protein [Magnetococcales bacterium]
MREINILQFSIDAVERDMQQSIHKITQAAILFSEPRRRRLEEMVIELAVFASENRNILFPEQASGLCRMVTPGGIFGFASFDDLVSPRHRVPCQERPFSTDNLEPEPGARTQVAIPQRDQGVTSEASLEQVNRPGNIGDVFWCRANTEITTWVEDNI